MVLLNSGGYEYAEIELGNPIHLVASNNVGKTSLISALQFLYIDSKRSLHFASHSLEETKRHYFPGSNSFVLFECMTPTGFQVVGLRGNGPARGFEFERFIYTGEYRESDFLNGRTPRTWNEVRRFLVSRSFRAVESTELRSLLIGERNSKGPVLGLIPMKRSESYASFRFLFRNLLSLSKVDQNKLKRLFVDIVSTRSVRTNIDLRTDFQIALENAEKKTREVNAFSKVEPKIKELTEAYERRLTCRGKYAALKQQVDLSLDDLEQKVQASCEEKQHESERLQQDKIQLEKEGQQLDKEKDKEKEALWQAKTQLNELERLKSLNESYHPELEEAQRKILSDRRDDLSYRIRSADQSDKARVEKSRQETSRRLENDIKLAEKFEHALITYLRKMSGLTEAELGDLFSVVNPSLMAQIVGKGGSIEIPDHQQFKRTISQISEKFDESAFAIGGVRIKRPFQDGGSRISDFESVEVIKIRIAADQREINRLDELLKDIEQRQKLEGELQKTERELNEARERLSLWEKWQKSKTEIPKISTRINESESRLQVLTNNKNLVRRKIEDIEANLINIREKRSKEIERMRKAQERVRELQEPGDDWFRLPMDDRTSSEHLDELTNESIQVYRVYRQLHQDAKNLFSYVELHTAAQYSGRDDDETIRTLNSQVQEMQTQRQAVEDLWSSLITSLGRALQDLVRAVEQVRIEVQRLSRALAKRQVSNLGELSVILKENESLLGKIRDLVHDEEAPLFADEQTTKAAQQGVRSWLELKERIDLADLFDLRIRTIDQRGNKKEYTSLDKIESTGTSTTIKVLIHLELMRQMISDNEAKIPFFLDEVSTIDSANLTSLVSHASAMNFIPVVASPNAGGLAVSTLYFILQGAQGVVLDKKSKVVIDKIG